MGSYQSTFGQTYSTQEIYKLSKSHPEILDFIPVRIIIGMSSNGMYNNSMYAYGPKYWMIYNSNNNSIKVFLRKYDTSTSNGSIFGLIFNKENEQFIKSLS